MGEIAMRIQERRLRLYGDLMIREEHYVGKRTMEIKVLGKRKRC